MGGLVAGLSQGREEQKKQRQLDLERLLQRYQNVKSELESQQNIERIKKERVYATAATARPGPNSGRSVLGQSKMS